jgi:Mrp family chromosome partitioning ATPase
MPVARTGGNVPLVVRAAATLSWPDDPKLLGPVPIDWRALVAAGHPDPRALHSVARGELQRIAGPLVRQAFAPHAGRRGRVVLVTSASAVEGRTFVALSLALTLARDRPVLLVDADPGPAGIAARFGLAAAKGLSDALADPALGPDRLIVRTELDRFLLLGPGATRSDLLKLIASRGMQQLLHQLLADDPDRLVMIDGPPLSRPEAQALALFAGQAVLVVQAGKTSRRALDSALDRLAEHTNVSLLLNRA